MTGKEAKPELAGAVAAAKAGEWDRAVAGLKRHLALHGDDEVACGLLASIYAELGMADRARQYYERVLQINPDNPLAREQLERLAQAGGGQSQSGEPSHE